MSAVEEDLIVKIEQTVAAARRQSLDELRVVLNETGIRRSRTAMADAPTILAKALTAEVEKKQTVKNAKADLEDEEDVAERLVTRPFVIDGNKTWLVDDDGTKVRTVLADEQKSIVAGLVRRHPTVVAARKRLQDAEHLAALAGVEVEVAKANLSISKHDVDAAAAELLLAAAIKKEEQR